MSLMIFRVSKMASAGAAICLQGIKTFFMESSTVIARAQRQRNATATQFDSRLQSSLFAVSTDLGLIDMFLINLNADNVACTILFKKSRHKSNLGSTSKYVPPPPILGGKWRRSEHAHASYPGLFFRSPGFSPYIGREERRVQGLD